MRLGALVSLLVMLAACGGDTSPPAVDAALPDAGGEPDGAGEGDAGPHDACDPGELPEDPFIVLTDRGPVRGVAGGGVTAFLGIPFAKPPVEDLRWQPPARPDCWTEIRDVASFPPACAQKHFEQGDPDGAGEPAGEEDCLYLDLWRPETATPGRPVLVFIHGGGHQQGSAGEQLGEGVRLYDGADLAARGDAIVVTIQYRLGPFGYLALPELADEAGHAGNWGLLDQIAALEWVAANAERFGGDPSRVLVFGESAGAVSTCALLASPLARDLFARALMQSGGCTAPPWTDREDAARGYADEVGCGDAEDLAACLRALSSEQLVEPLEHVFSGGLVAQRWGPVVDGWALPVSPMEALLLGDQAPVPLVVGTNRDETALSIPPGSVGPEDVAALLDRFAEPWRSALEALYPPGETRPAARDSMVRMTSDAQFICPVRRIARAVVRGDLAPAYRYSFDYTLSAPRFELIGAAHGIELAFVFGAIDRMPAYSPTEDDRTIADAMQDAWTAFARTGDPNAGDLPRWPAYEPGSDPFWRIEAPAPIADEGLRTDECDVWDAVPPA